MCGGKKKKKKLNWKNIKGFGLITQVVNFYHVEGCKRDRFDRKYHEVSRVHGTLCTGHPSRSATLQVNVQVQGISPSWRYIFRSHHCTERWYLNV